MGRTYSVVCAALVATTLVLSLSCSSPTEPSSSGTPPVVVANGPSQEEVEASFAKLSPGAQKFVLLSNIEAYGSLTRWTVPVMRIYAGQPFSHEDLKTATDFWRDKLRGKMSFQIVGERSQADTVFEAMANIPNLPDWACGLEGPKQIGGGVIITGFGHYAYGFKPGCMNVEYHYPFALAHGIGHVLGIHAHTPIEFGVDIMSSPTGMIVLSQEVEESVNWIYANPPGFKFRR